MFLKTNWTTTGKELKIFLSLALERLLILMVLVSFQFWVLFYAISYNPITVSTVFTIDKNKAVAILRAFFHMFRVESIFDLFIAIFSRVLQLPLFPSSHVCLHIQVEIIFITIPILYIIRHFITWGNYWPKGFTVYLDNRNDIWALIIVICK